MNKTENFNYEEFYEDYWFEDFWTIDRNRKRWLDNYVTIKVLNKWMPLYKKNLLVDMGGGVGNWSWYFREHFNKIAVLEISNSALSKIPEDSTIKIHSSLLKTPLKDKSVDYILLIDVFEHIHSKDLKQALNEWRRILKDNGRIIIDTTQNGWGIDLIFYKLIGKKRPEFKGHLIRLKFKEFKELFQEHNFKIDDYYHYSIFFRYFVIKIKENINWLVTLLLKKRIGNNKTFPNNKEFDDEDRDRIIYLKSGFVEKVKESYLSYLLYIPSWICYLDLLIFGKWFQGSTIYLNIKKEGENGK